MANLYRVTLAAVLLLLSTALAAPEKERWFGYTSPTRRGAFDMLEVSGWEGSQLRKNGPWSYTIYFRYSARTVVLDQVQFDTFAVIFDKYLQRP